MNAFPYRPISPRNHETIMLQKMTEIGILTTYHCRLILFFFQAEDGIRDIGVTGVQTCALPISAPVTEAARAQILPSDVVVCNFKVYFAVRPFAKAVYATGLPALGQFDRIKNLPKEIGRASCRERV